MAYSLQKTTPGSGNTLTQDMVLATDGDVFVTGEFSFEKVFDTAGTYVLMLQSEGRHWTGRISVVQN